MPPPPLPESRTLRRRLLGWFRAHARELPWRRTRDPWAIFVSEIMLHQTRVEAVVPHYERFLEAYPDPATLAEAPEREVLSCWSGLGYYQRARQLQCAAGDLVREHAGRFPRDTEAALRLPGVGAYTAGAVLSIAYDIPVPVVDGNVVRVLSRLFRVRGDVGTARVRRRLWGIARSLVPRRRAGDWNQALMELGALVCLPLHPRCERCPVEGLCAARRSGVERILPERGRRRKTVVEELSAAVVRDGRGRVLLVMRESGGGLVKGLLEPPWVQGNGEAALRDHLFTAHGICAQLVPVGPLVRHAILDRRLRVRVWAGRTSRGDHPKGGADWVENPANGPVSSLARKILAAAGVGELPASRGAGRSARRRRRGGPRASSR